MKKETYKFELGQSAITAENIIWSLRYVALGVAVAFWGLLTII